MGGGTAMRAAAKVACMNVGLRGVCSTDHHPFTDAARKAAAAASQSLFSNPNIEDWEDLKDETMLVFGDAPTLKEAQDATFQLKETVNKAYLSPNVISSTEPATLDFEVEACVVNKDTTPTTQAIRAFRLLNENTAAQKVVASIASDPNVWNAVLQNEALVGFLKSHKNISDMNWSGEGCGVKDDDETCKLGDKNVIEEIVQNMKEKVEEMMNNLSDYFQYLFGGGTLAPNDGQEKAMNASFMGLAVMVILVVVLDRQ